MKELALKVVCITKASQSSAININVLLVVN